MLVLQKNEISQCFGKAAREEPFLHGPTVYTQMEHAAATSLSYTSVRVKHGLWSAISRKKITAVSKALQDVGSVQGMAVPR